MFTRAALALTAAVLLGAPAAAADKKPGGLRDFPFWTGPKLPHARAFVPGLQASLGITPEQAEKIEAACRDTIDRPEVRNAGKNGGAQVAEAVEQLHKKVAEILTADQKALIERTNAAYARVVAEVGEEFQGAYAAAKGNPDEAAKVRQQVREAVAEAFGKKLDALLTADQKQAVEKAAAEERKRADKTIKP